MPDYVLLTLASSLVYATATALPDAAGVLLIGAGPAQIYYESALPAEEQCPAAQ